MPDVEILIAAAAAFAPPGAPEKEAFTLLLRGLEYHQLETDDLAGLAADLRAGQAPGFGELLFEPRGRDRLVATFLSHKVECQAAPLIEAVDRLAAASAKPDPSPAPTRTGGKR